MYSSSTSSTQLSISEVLDRLETREAKRADLPKPVLVPKSNKSIKPIKSTTYAQSDISKARAVLERLLAKREVEVTADEEVETAYITKPIKQLYD